MEGFGLGEVVDGAIAASDFVLDGFLVARVGVEWQDVPGIEGFAVRSRKTEGGDLIFGEAELLWVAEIVAQE